MFRSWLKTHCSPRGCLHVDSICCVCAWVRATSGCVWYVPADSCCGAHPEPPLTQPTTFPPPGYPAVLREATWNLEGSKFIRVYRRGRRQDGAGEKRRGKRRGGQKDLSHTRRLRGRREGWNKVRNRRNPMEEGSTGTEACWLTSRVIAGKSRGTWHLPAGDSSTQTEGCCPALPLSAGVLIWVYVSLHVHSMEAVKRWELCWCVKAKGQGPYAWPATLMEGAAFTKRPKLPIQRLVLISAKSPAVSATEETRESAYKHPPKSPSFWQVLTTVCCAASQARSHARRVLQSEIYSLETCKIRCQRCETPQQNIVISLLSFI